MLIGGKTWHVEERQFLAYEFFMKLIKRNGRVTIVDSINDVLIVVVKS